jgi:predicted  nucleic acid-binding Zn-ribbon protein
LTFFVHLGKFDIEKQNLLDELEMLRRARETFEQEKRSRDQELRQIRDRSRVSSDELKNMQAKVHSLEQQVLIYFSSIKNSIYFFI